jgi:predicted RNase H-like HicB family nuclease
MDYLAVIEQAPDGRCSAHGLDLPGCVTCADSEQKVRGLIEEAVTLHVESLRSHAEPLPPPGTSTHTIHIV